MKLVMFDMDGTLTDSFSLDENCYFLAIEQALGLSKIVIDWDELTHTSSSYWLEEIVRRARGAALTPAESRTVQMRMIQLMDEITCRSGRCTSQLPGARRCLETLESLGYAIAIASGDWEMTARHKLQAAGLPFDRWPKAFCDVAHARTEIMRTALSRASQHYGCEQFERIVYVGDGAWDVRACRELGWPLIGIGEGAHATRLRSLGAKHVIPHYDPLEPFLTALDQAAAPVADQRPAA